MLDDDQPETPTYRLRLWTYGEAVDAIPYLCAVLKSLRDAWLKWGQVRETLRRLGGASGRLNRAALIRREEANLDANRAEAEFEEILQELISLDIACLDPTQGQALIPFQQDGLLAWFVFDLFAVQHVNAWRFHSDPIEVQRPLTGVQRLRVLSPTHND
ncbi:MAG TPA: hypothetical protein VGM05_06755 [Planctomycetaceae bacterium]